MDQWVSALVEQGGWAVFGGLALYLLYHQNKARVQDKEEMISCLEAEREKLLDVVEKLAAALGRNTEVVDRNTQAFVSHEKAFQELQVTLKKLNGKP